ncbi:connector enhancer of kinase suppressor of ras 1 isoform X1 [Arapaima gigas]
MILSKHITGPSSQHQVVTPSPRARSAQGHTLRMEEGLKQPGSSEVCCLETSWRSMMQCYHCIIPPTDATVLLGEVTVHPALHLSVGVSVGGTERGCRVPSAVRRLPVWDSAMERVASWAPERVSGWLRGLDASLQQYPFNEWQVSGEELLKISSLELERLGVHKIGHQELILEAVEKLCSLTYNTGGMTLRAVTEKLRTVAHSLQMSTQGRWRVNTYNGQTAIKLPVNVLQAVLDVLTAAKGLFSLLNRYHFTELSGYVASHDIITHCQALGTVVQKEVTVYEKEKDIISICRQLVAVCDDILSNSPESLLDHTPHLESVHLVPISPGEHLGIEITSTGSNEHFVTGTNSESAAEFSEGILVGDEVVQVNGQIVLGWSRANLVRKLQENPGGVTLVLKKVPMFKHQERLAVSSTPEREEEQRHSSSVLDRVASSVRSLSFRTAVQGGEAEQPMGQEESEPAFDSTSPDLQGQITFTKSEQEDTSNAKGFATSGPKGSVGTGQGTISSCPEMVGQKVSTWGSTRTAMSRRRVSCRELGRPDCDGWLWKKKKDSSVFLTPKWQRFWFVLKGSTLYWYRSQQEEKAEGLVKIPSYSIESAGEHKRKYVFKMCHERFQTFIFAADNVSDMSKWINCLITAIQKYKKVHKDPPDSEEECYSETEPEDEGSHSPRSHRSKVDTKPQSNTLPRFKGKKNKELVGTATVSLTSGGSRAPGTTEDEMGILFQRLKQDGVSLIGHEQPVTHDHFRRSFIRRSKNPVINEKAHTLRALQSTLKARLGPGAKEAELQVINKILEETSLTSEKFRQWKEQNEDLYQEIERLAVEKTQEQTQVLGEEVARETGAVKDSVGGVSLSDGEQLVDAEESGNSALELEAELSASPHRGDRSTTSTEYFFI